MIGGATSIYAVRDMIENGVNLCNTLEFFLGLAGVLGGATTIRGAMRQLEHQHILRQMRWWDQNRGKSSAPKFNQPSIIITYSDQFGRIRTDKYILDRSAQRNHMSGSSDRSQFLHKFADIDIYEMTLKAAHYADDHNLWSTAPGGNLRAKVYIDNGPVGIVSTTGQQTSWINVYIVQKQGSLWVHSSPTGTPGVIP